MDHQAQQLELVAELRAKGIKNEAVLQAIATVPRELFISEDLQDYAYSDSALPIDCHQTISQPYIVARMTEAMLGRGKVSKVLEIGTGSGYQAAVLAQLVPEVYSIERINTLLKQAQARFKKLNITNIHTLHGDGNLGWPEHSPYDGILVTAASPIVPQALLEQLAENGRMIIPVGESIYGGQELRMIICHGDDFESIKLDAVTFVPMLTGKTD